MASYPVDQSLPLSMKVLIGEKERTGRERVVVYTLHKLYILCTAQWLLTEEKEKKTTFLYFSSVCLL